MKVYIIGIGMDGAKTLTEEGRAAIEAADLLIGAERMLAPFEGMDKMTFCSWKADEISAFLRSRSFKTAAVLMSGDCGFYSGAMKLISVLGDFDIEIISGISSPVYFCSKIRIPWQEMKFVSLHGTDGNIIRNIRRNRYCFFLLGGEASPTQICKKLCEYGMWDIGVYIGEALSYENERILSGSASDFVNMQFDRLSVMVTENSSFEQGVPSGIPDENFIRGSVPMTKSEVRSCAVSKLNIGSRDICWDIGCGTGSVSVEMAMQCFDGRVYAADKKEEAVDLTKQNSIKFGCDNIKVISGTAPECLNDLPPPDKAFVGGSCGRIKDILDIVFEKNPNAVIVITAVSLETLHDAANALAEHEIDSPEIVQLAVTRTRKAGTHTMLISENPVFIIKGVRN